MENKHLTRRCCGVGSCLPRYLTIFIFLIQTDLFGQNIPDEKFAKAIRTSCSTCVDSANNLTAAAKSVTYLNVEYSDITDLTGIVGFLSLQHLDCSSNNLSFLPTLPSSLKILYCSKNKLRTLPTLPKTLADLTCSKNLLTDLPILPNSLRFLTCSENRIANLPDLPSELRYLICHTNQLSHLNSLPRGIQIVECYNNQIYCMPFLPTSLLTLALDADKITCLPNSISDLVILNASLSPSKTPPPCINPTIASEVKSSMPANIICEGQQLTLTAKAVGIGHMTAKWQRKKANAIEFSDVPFSVTVYTSDTEASFTTSELRYAENNISFRCVFENCNKSVFTNPVTIKVNPSVKPAVLLTFSTNTTVYSGTVVNLNAQSWNSGTAPKYQWLINDEAVKDKTDTTLQLTNPTADYNVKVQMISNVDCRSFDTVLSNVLTLKGDKLLIPSPSILTATTTTPIASEQLMDKPLEQQADNKDKNTTTPVQIETLLSINKTLPAVEKPPKVVINHKPKKRKKEENKVEKVKIAVLAKGNNDISREFVKLDANKELGYSSEKIIQHQESLEPVNNKKVIIKAYNRNAVLSVIGLVFFTLSAYVLYQKNKKLKKGKVSEE